MDVAREELSEAQSARVRRLVDAHPEAVALGTRFAAAGHELWLVGGVVRDALRGVDAADRDDLDFATSAHPEQSERLLNGWADALWLTGARFGTVSAEKAGRRVEVTTFRADAYSPGSRHPEVTYGDRIEADLSRRDFTVNALAVELPTLRFVDPFGGVADLERGVLRTPVDPEVSFADDPLRMVRLARFVAVLGAEPDPQTEAAAGRMAAQLDTISAERVRDELSKLLVGATPGAGLDLLLRTGLSDRFLPELARLKELRDPQQRHKDVYLHTLAVVERCPPDLVLRLAALLHDVAKPDTRRIYPDGKVTFHHHEVLGAKFARKRLTALRYDRHTVDQATELVRLHLRFHTYRMGWTDSAVRRYVADAGPLLDLLNALTRADCTTRNRRRAEQLNARMDELERRIAELREREELERLRPALDGHAIMGHLGLPPGPLVGDAWHHLLELRIEQGPMTEDEAKAALDAWWSARSGG